MTPAQEAHIGAAQVTSGDISDVSPDYIVPSQTLSHIAPSGGATILAFRRVAVEEVDNSNTSSQATMLGESAATMSAGPLAATYTMPLNVNVGPQRLWAQTQSLQPTTASRTRLRSIILPVATRGPLARPASRMFGRFLSPVGFQFSTARKRVAQRRLLRGRARDPNTIKGQMALQNERTLMMPSLRPSSSRRPNEYGALRKTHEQVAAVYLGVYVNRGPARPQEFAHINDDSRLAQLKMAS